MSLSGPKWKFKDVEPDRYMSNPVEAQFHKGKREEDILNSFFREGLQNSLDASSPKSDATYIKVSLFNGEKAADQRMAQQFFDGLWPHLEALEDGIDVTQLKEKSKIPYLVIEDFGTTGLRGDPEVPPSEDADPSNDFFYFFRNSGRSKKSEEDQGRWGVGKTVFPASSDISSFFGYTIREGEEQGLLMGHSIWKIHKLNGKKQVPYGYYAKFKKNGVQLPVTDDKKIKEFKEVFTLKRADESGLSLVVPFPKKNLINKFDPFIYHSIISNAFYPIIKGKLSVHVDMGSSQEVINKNTIRKITEQIDWKESDKDKKTLLKLYDFVDWTLEAESFELPKTAGKKRSPKWTEDYLPEETRKKLKHKFEKKQRLAIKVPILLREKKNGEIEKQKSYFYVYLEKDQNLQNPDEHYLRSDLVLPGIQHLDRRRVRGMVIVEQKKLSELLGNTEGPSHQEWQMQSLGLKDKYEYAPSVSGFVQKSLRNIVRAMTESRDDKDKYFLSDLLPLPEKRKKVDNGGGDAGGGVGVEISTTEPEPWNITKLKGGFRVKGENTNTQIPNSLRIELGYSKDIRGSGIAAYDPKDFKVDNDQISLYTENVKITEKVDNIIKLNITENDFTLKAQGFDEKRDLEVRVTGGE